MHTTKTQSLESRGVGSVIEEAIMGRDHLE